MNFDNIEGLSEKEIEELFDDALMEQGDFVGGYWFGGCWTSVFNASFNCIAEKTPSWTQCSQHVHSLPHHTEAYLKEQCFRFCGYGSFVAYMQNWTDDGTMYKCKTLR